VTSSVRIKAVPARALAKINKPDRARLCAAIDGLKSAPQAGTVLKGEGTGLRRLRVGRYRVVYEVVGKEAVVLVVYRPEVSVR
jgi:mRNA interferase RelE/StbE